MKLNVQFVGCVLASVMLLAGCESPPANDATMTQAKGNVDLALTNHSETTASVQVVVTSVSDGHVAASRVFDVGALSTAHGNLGLGAGEYVLDVEILHNPEASRANPWLEAAGAGSATFVVASEEDHFTIHIDLGLKPAPVSVTDGGPEMDARVDGARDPDASTDVGPVEAEVADQDGTETDRHASEVATEPDSEAAAEASTEMDESGGEETIEAAADESGGDTGAQPEDSGSGPGVEDSDDEEADDDDEVVISISLFGSDDDDEEDEEGLDLF